MTDDPEQKWQAGVDPALSPIRPALTAEEWAYFTSGGIQKHVQQYAIEAAERDREHDLTTHALAALCLYGQPFGFTPEDVAMLMAEGNLNIAAAPGEADDWQVMAGIGWHQLRLARKIAALLPPPP